MHSLFRYVKTVEKQTAYAFKTLSKQTLSSKMDNIFSNFFFLVGEYKIDATQK